MKIKADKGAIRRDGTLVGHYMIPPYPNVPIVHIFVDGIVIDKIEYRRLPKRSKNDEKSPMVSWVEQNKRLRWLLENEAKSVPESVDVADNLSG